jgi:hypothetical protein
MRDFEIKPHLTKVLKKLSRKDSFAYEAVLRKIQTIVKAADVDNY